ncbi:MAG: hypothetical protein QG637_1386 [Chloroflexota bacterium]|nr:hypothetical protein [Chloroflexota bacterium]
MKSQKFAIGGRSIRSCASQWVSMLLIAGGLLLNSALARAQTDTPPPAPVTAEAASGPRLDDPLLAPGSDAGSPAEPQAVSDWAHVVVVGDGANLGRRPSLGFSPSNNRPFISFYDGVNQQLMLAWRTANVNDTCGTLRGWQCAARDNTASAGDNSALAFLQNGSGQVGVAYTIPNSKSLIRRRFDANGVFVAVDGTQSAGGGNNYIGAGDLLYQGSSAIWSSETFDGQQKRLIVLDDRLPGTSILVERDDTATSNKLGRYASLDLGPGYNGIDGMTTRAAYSGETGSLRYAEWQNGGNGNGCAGTIDKWVCRTVDHDADVYSTALYSPKCANCGDSTRIAYFDATTDRLKLATYVGGSGTCNTGSAPGWQCQVIDAIAVAKTTDGVRVSMVVQNGQIKIAYTDKDSQANSILKLASYTGNANDICAAGGATGWKCEVVDDGGNQDHTGFEPSLAWKGDQLTIAYHNLSKGRLMVAYPKVNLAGQISFTLNMPVKPVAVGEDFTFAYTISNKSAITLTGLEFTDYLTSRFLLKEMQSNTCAATIEVTPGNLTSSVKMRNGALAPNTACAVIVKAQIRKGIVPGVYDEPINGTLTSNEAYPIAGSATPITVVAKMFLPVITR